MAQLFAGLMPVPDDHEDATDGLHGGLPINSYQSFNAATFSSFGYCYFGRHDFHYKKHTHSARY